MSGEFQTVFGGNLVAELSALINRPYTVVTMAIADVRAVDDAVVATVRGLVEGASGPRTGAGLG